MKTKCSLCEGQLLMNENGEYATCLDCGMGYTVDFLLRAFKQTSKTTKQVKEEVQVIIPPAKQPAQVQETPRIIKKTDIPTLLWESVKTEPVKIHILNSYKVGYETLGLQCEVESGSFDLTGIFYADNDDKKSCKIGMMKSGGTDISYAEKGMKVELTVYGSQIKRLKNAKYLTAPKALCGSDEEEEFFSRLLTSCFKEYVIKRDVCVTEEKPAVPVTFMMYKKNKPVLAIILCSSRVYAHKKIRNTIRACEKHRIKTQRYFAEFENDREYVIDRIRKAL